MIDIYHKVLTDAYYLMLVEQGEDSQKNYWCKSLACAEQQAGSVDDLAFLLVLILFFYRLKKDYYADSQG